MLSLFVFSAMGVAIAAATWWYVVTLRDIFLVEKRTYVLGDVEIIGDAEMAETYKRILPRLIVVKLAKLRNEADDAFQSLKEARSRRSGHGRLQSQELMTERDFPEPFSQPLDVELKIAGIGCGADALALSSRALVREAVSYGHLQGTKGYSFSEGSKGAPDDVAEAIAAAIVAEVIKREEPALAAHLAGR